MYDKRLQCMQTNEEKLVKADGSCHKDVFLAAIEGDIECLVYNLDNGADVNALGKPKAWGYRFEKASAFYAAPLHYAVAYGRESAVKLLLERGANIDQKSHSGLSSVDYARLRGYIQLSAMLEATRG
ncbi:Ankyrin repeat domain-containing protein 2B [Diplonema papillatum]|nr:Ankyrin repeat domain-containing protein 2B [Diplonema papillatum]